MSRVLRAGISAVAVLGLVVIPPATAQADHRGNAQHSKGHGAKVHNDGSQQGSASNKARKSNARGNNGNRGNVRDNSKVTICHIPPGNPDNAHTITISRNALSAHVENHGDTMGPCPTGVSDGDAVAGRTASNPGGVKGRVLADGVLAGAGGKAGQLAVTGGGEAPKHMAAGLLLLLGLALLGGSALISPRGTK